MALGAITVEVKSTTKDVLRELTVLEKRVSKAATNAAINTTARRVRTLARRTAAEILDFLPQKHLTPRIKLIPSNFRTLSAYLIALTNPLNIYAIYGEAGAWRIPGSFMATMPSGHKGLWVHGPGSKAKRSRNTGKWSELPIDPARLDIHTVLTQRFTYYMRTFAPKEFRRQFEREIAWRSAKLQQRSYRRGRFT